LSYRIVFLVYDGCEVLDFAGPVQAFHEAIALGAEYETEYVGLQKTVVTAQGLSLGELKPLPEMHSNNIVMVAGGAPLRQDRVSRAFSPWLREAYAAGAMVGSICTGAFALAHAGLLDGRNCTTHWKFVSELQRRCPTAIVHPDRLFVEDRRILTSAGVASGIDMALALIAQHYGPRIASQAAREMVVYIRRDGRHTQRNVYLDYRSHFHPGVHQVQDWLIAHPEEKATIEQLAALSNMSTRTLTRSFRQATGISVQEFRAQLRLERAKVLRRNPGLSMEEIARGCGYSDARQLRRLRQTAPQYQRLARG
jgi:transcriptional regulator GlxA family with amidase domain